CFVRGGRLVAASQRDVSQAFPALTRGTVDNVRARLWRFWRERMHGCLQLRDCGIPVLRRGAHFPVAFDVYVPSDSQATRLMDVNPLVDTTSPLLYDWPELGFGAGAVRPAEELLRELLEGSGVAAPAMAVAPGDEGGGGGLDESWMEEGAELMGGITLPTCAEEL
ncbi:hypothetical protein TSOC_015258, partial [Tetrabaena socialis]